MPHLLENYYEFKLPIQTCSVFHLAVETADVDSIHLLKNLYPQCLQEHWFITYQCEDFRFDIKCFKTCFKQLQNERKNPPRLDVLCRINIFQQLGYNPITKAEILPLPRMLRDFVQGRDIKGLHE